MSSTSTATTTRERSPSPAAGAAGTAEPIFALRTPAKLGVQSTIIDGRCYDIGKLMDTHPGQARGDTTGEQE